jgi:hypothetical protein
MGQNCEEVDFIGEGKMVVIADEQGFVEHVKTISITKK